MWKISCDGTGRRQITDQHKVADNLGGGGMGVVYRADDACLKRTIAFESRARRT